MVRGLLAQPSGDPDRPYRRMILLPLVNQEILDFLGSDRGKELALTPTLTSDHLVRTKALPLWIDDPDYNDPAKLREQIVKGMEAYAADYQAYLARNAALMPARHEAFRFPAARGFAARAGSSVRGQGRARGTHRARHYRANARRQGAHCRHGNLPRPRRRPSVRSGILHLAARQAAGPMNRRWDARSPLVTGAAGAIGSAIAEGLLEQGCHVALTDLPAAALDNLGEELKKNFGERVMTAALDVTDPASVEQGFDAVSKNLGWHRPGNYQRRAGHGYGAGADGSRRPSSASSGSTPRERSCCCASRHAISALREPEAILS